MLKDGLSLSKNEDEIVPDLFLFFKKALYEVEVSCQKPSLNMFR